MEHVLPIQINAWSSKKANSLDTKVRLGTRISSFDEMEIVFPDSDSMHYWSFPVHKGQMTFKVFYVVF
ncbi:hypothetical protein TSUD_286610 [Trifolium subterraneum]|uniref:Uncharacterized protein n=1 Tax=Trifolium subterraneum TaxID=3900 RepID=A0A2Z6PGH5_TRISU|nr:hypothetical protein TSUD_286610 [Trifolium subterraneum]